MARGRPRKSRRGRKPAEEPVVNEFAAQHGEYGSALIVDLNNELGGGRQKTYRVIRNLYPDIVDRWLAEGGPGFEEPQRRAIDHCRMLWHRVGSIGKLVSNFNSTGGGGGGPERGLEQMEAISQLALYEKRIPSAYWSVFENVVRHGFTAGEAGTHLATHRPNQIAHAKNSVGFVASLIAMWEGY
jgi:hypothetical protein